MLLFIILAGMWFVLFFIAIIKEFIAYFKNPAGYWKEIEKEIEEEQRAAE